MVHGFTFCLTQTAVARRGRPTFSGRLRVRLCAFATSRLFCIDERATAPIETDKNVRPTGREETQVRMPVPQKGEGRVRGEIGWGERQAGMPVLQKRVTATRGASRT